MNTGTTTKKKQLHNIQEKKKLQKVDKASILSKGQGKKTKSNSYLNSFLFLTGLGSSASQWLQNKAKKSYKITYLHLIKIHTYHVNDI